MNNKFYQTRRRLEVREIDMVIRLQFNLVIFEYEKNILYNNLEFFLTNLVLQKLSNGILKNLVKKMN